MKPSTDKYNTEWKRKKEPLAKLDPWFGLTPEEAYRKGRRDERIDALEKRVFDKLR